MGSMKSTKTVIVVTPRRRGKRGVRIKKGRTTINIGSVAGQIIGHQTIKGNQHLQF